MSLQLKIGAIWFVVGTARCVSRPITLLLCQENLGSFASHAFQQMQQRNISAHWPWELTPQAALIPNLGSTVPPVRVYVYGESEAPALGRLTRSAAFCHYRQWGMDVGFHDFFRSSPVRTFEPHEADYFFVPSYACCHQVAGMAEFPELDRDYEEAVSQLAYFQRTGGREAWLDLWPFSFSGTWDIKHICLVCDFLQDHIFSFHYIDLFPSWRKRIPKSVILTPETEVGFERSLGDFGLDQTRFAPFNPLKDIVVPPLLGCQNSSFAFLFLATWEVGQINTNQLKVHQHARHLGLPPA